MKKSPIFKLLVLILALSMTVSLFACDNDVNSETKPEETKELVEETTEAVIVTDEPTAGATEKPNEETTEAATEAPTETPTASESENDTGSETVSETETETVKETVTETEAPTEEESETIPEGPAEPLCDTCSFKTVKGIPICKVCGYVAPCLGVHEYVGKVEGHNKPACEHCGKGEGKIQNHEYTEYVEDEGDLLYYSYICDICYYVAYAQEVPYEINLFYPASEIANVGASGSVEGSYKFVSGIGYGEFARDAGDAGASSTITIEDSGSIEDDPVGQYMAIRLRLPRSQTGITIELKSVHSDDKLSYKMNGLKPGWITLAIDLSKFSKPDGNGGTMGYVADNFGDFYLERIALVTYIGSGESIDIAYTLFCEEKEDLMAFIGNDRNCYFYEDIFTKAPEIANPINCKHDFIIDEENGTHTLKDPCFECGMAAVSEEEHSYIEIIGGGKNSYECSICGYAKYLKLVPESVNKYVSASELDSGGIIYYPYTNFNHGLHVEPGDAYTRYEGPLDWKDNVGQVIFARDNADFAYANTASTHGIRINVGDAIYFVLRVRVNTENLTPLTVTISTTGHDGVENGVENNCYFRIPVAQSPKDTWCTYVINLEKTFPDRYLPDGNGDYVVDTFYFNICHGTFDEGVTLDLSYMAYCSDWDEVAAIVDEEQLFYLSDGTGSGNWANSDTRKCVGECTLGDADITENKEEGTVTYEFKCSVCGSSVTSKTIDSSVTRYYYAGELANTAKTYYQINGAANGRHGQIVHDQETGRVFSRYTGYEKKNVITEAETNEAGEVITEEVFEMVPQPAQVLWQRAQDDMWGGQTSSTVEHYTESVGNAEWLVLRAKTNKPSQGFTFYLSTTEWDAEDGKSAGSNVGGMLSIKIPLGASEEDEWTTYVVNLKNLFPAQYVKDSETGEYVIDSFYFGFGAFAATTYIDIEYIAFVEGGWTELDALIDEDVAISIADSVGGYGYTNVSTGSCVEHTASLLKPVENSDGSITYNYVCGGCAEYVVSSKTIPATVGEYLTADKISANVALAYQISNLGARMDEGEYFARFEGQGKGNQILWIRSEDDFKNSGDAKNGQKYDVGDSTKMIIKIRSNVKLNYLDLSLSTEGKNGFGRITLQYPNASDETLRADNLKENEWTVLVIDLATIIPEYYLKAEGADSYVIDTLIFTPTETLASGQYIDIAYFAFAESWAEIDAIVDEATATQILSADGTSAQIVNVNDGSVVTE